MSGQLQRLVLEFRSGELVVRCLYRTQEGPNGAKGRRRQVSELAREGLQRALASLEGETTLVGCSGFTQREDVLLADTREEGSAA